MSNTTVLYTQRWSFQVRLVLCGTELRAGKRQLSVSRIYYVTTTTHQFSFLTVDIPMFNSYRKIC